MRNTIKIAVACHKPCKLINDDIFINIHGGRKTEFSETNSRRNTDQKKEFVM